MKSLPLLLLLAACADLDASPREARCVERSAGCAPVFDPQGPLLLDTARFSDETHRFKLNVLRRGTTPIHVTRFDRHGLELSDGGSAIGVEFYGGVIELTIENVFDDGLAETPPMYHVKVTTGPGSYELCTGGAAARLLPGHFTSDGVFHLSTELVSFACPGGAGAKAWAWGYDPWSITPFYQAASRMIRGDYCGDGWPHTIRGTRIGYLDLHGYFLDAVGTSPPLPGDDDYKFEAAWHTDPARGALCISRWRWQALMPDLCGALLPDPREFKYDGKVCEDLAAAGGPPPASEEEMFERLEALGAGTFSFVKDREAGLWTWKGAGERFLSTTAGYWGGAHLPTSPPDADHPVMRDYVAMLFAEPDVGRKQLKVYRFEDGDGDVSDDFYRTTTKPVVTTPGPLIGWKLHDKLGYIYPTVPAGLAHPSWIWRKIQSRHMPGTNRYILVAPGVSIPAPHLYTDVVDEGYTLR